MNDGLLRNLVTSLGALLWLLSLPLSGRAAETGVPATIEFNRDVRPILSDKCFFCHGPDGSHRGADLRLDVRSEAVDYGAVVPGKPEESLLIERILSEDSDSVMPPPASHKKLDAREKAILRAWITQGAEYQAHWSYVPPVKAAVPAEANAIDFLVQRRIADAGLKPSPQADRRTLIRRLHADLLGLPPSPEDVAAFVNDPAPDAYERLVDRLLANPHYGERMAIGWLDVVRFADTIGYHSDTPRNVSPYRDWVISSFNDNKPFDQFTIEQVAGDLLPDVTQETRVGSAFNRLLLSTEEGGAQPKDYEARMVADRVRAIGTTWLAQTTGCAECHDHKFDPFTSRDFYSLGAFFADIQEPIIGRREEGMLVTTPEQDRQLAELEARLKTATRKLAAVAPELEDAQAEWVRQLRESGKITLPELQADSRASAADKKTAESVIGILKKEQPSPPEQQTLRTYFRDKVTDLYPAERKAVVDTERALQRYRDSLPKCLVSVSMSRKRTVRILPRGNWQDESGEIMKPTLPHYLPQPEVEGRELTRLDLAQFLISRDNPLTARVFVNRLWKQFFGIGLSKVLDDLGAQGETPVNPELLDWLACEFMDSGWNVKHLVRLIVTSQTYRQTVNASPEQLAADPDNRLCGRQSPFRLDAELVRDSALAISGQLVRTIGGPSVKPYQPDGYWENLNFPTRTYTADTGPGQHRRGMYTWWQRSFLHPSLMAFDAPSREECCAERTRSNIPQQALVLLNDPTYVEAARAFAARVLRERQGSDDDRLAHAWQLALQRDPQPEELQLMTKLLSQHRDAYRADPDSAVALLKVGQLSVPEGIDPVELAAWTHITRVLLNLHETITRP